jgi:hypothetical protein
MSVTVFPHYQLNDIPEALRLLANKIEHGDVSAVRCVVCIEPDHGMPTYSAFGAEPFTMAHASGLCFYIANEVFG